ncbi:MAG TPA: alpha/beta hydrolase [Alphaproteobacteria bacterium]|nr:alpha/beta hydrolase [Alphaproteobacteria bacterium]
MIGSALAAGAAVYVAVSGTLYVFQRRLVFMPSGRLGSPADAGVPEMEEVFYPTSDGLTLRAWYRAAGNGRLTIAYFHGNAGHLGERAFKARYFIEHGYGFLLTSYRGYSGNPGRPTESRVYDDGRAALAFLADRKVAPAATVLYGESLGTGVAVQLAVERPAAALVLEAPFTSLADVAARRYWWTPARWLLRDRFASLDKIARVAKPLLVVHGERDRTVRAELGERLFAAAMPPKELKLIPGAGHADLYEYGAGDVILEFLERRFGMAASADQSFFQTPH